jgi:hypothetical protein
MADDQDNIAKAGDDATLLLMAKKHIKDAKSHTANWRQEAVKWYDFDAGTQWSEEDKSILREQMRPITTFNRIGPVINAVAGSEITNRQQATFKQRAQEDAGVSALVTAAAAWVRDQCDAGDEESDAFRDAVTCGMGWTETRLDYEEEPDGKILVERVDPLEMFWDPGSKKKNLSDSLWLARAKYLHREDIEALWPQARELAIGDSDPWGDLMGLAGEQQPHLADKIDAYEGDSGNEAEQYRGKFRVVEYQWCERAPMWRVLDPTQNRVINLTEAKYKKLRDAVSEAGGELQAVKQTQKRYKRAFFLGGHVLERGDSPCPSGFTYKCITGYRDRNNNTWYGLVRAMIDPQMWANKWLSQALHIFNSQAKGGIMAEADAFANVRKAEQDWSKPDAITLLNPGAISQKKIEAKPVAEYPASMDKLMGFAITAIRDVTGVNLEMLGLADRQQAGVLEEHRKKAGLTILAPLFDALRRYRKEQGRLLLYFIQEYISDGRLIRIAGANGNPRFVPLVKQPETAQYDIIVDEIPHTPSQKEATWAALMQILPSMQEIMPPKLWPEIIKESPLPHAFAEKAEQIINERLAQPPAPDPKIELEKRKLMVEIEGKKMDQQSKMIDLEIKKVEAGAAMKEIDMKAQTDQQKAALEIEVARMKAEADRIKTEAQMAVVRERAAVLEEKDKESGQEAEVFASASVQQARVLAQALERGMHEIAVQLAKAVSAPKKVIRDEKTGRAVGVQTVI